MKIFSDKKRDDPSRAVSIKCQIKNIMKQLLYIHI